MSEYWIEFGKVALAHLLAVASPGPDFAIVLRQSLAHGRRTALWTSVGVGSAILLHVTYSLFGLGLLVRSSAGWFDALKFAGAAYIGWLGVQALRSRARTESPHAGVAAEENAPTARGAFTTGFLTNALNPKATLFFIALFATVIGPTTPKLVQAGYGLWMATATAAWFSLVAMVFARERVRLGYWRHGHWIDRALGVVFLGFAASLVLTRLS
jgi:RhtB (resistance to homoserine/threonine) family protein